MKIALIIPEHIPSQWAHSINFMKHAQGFFDLSHKVKILTVLRLRETLNKLKIKDIHDFYGINQKIRIRYFRDFSLLYFKETRIRKFDLTYVITKFPKLYNIYNPEKKIGEFCRKNEIDLAYCRGIPYFKGTISAVFYNIINKIPTVLESHLYRIPTELKRLLKLSKNKYFKGLLTVSDVLKRNFVKVGVPKEKILVLEDAVDLAKFDSIKADKTTIRNTLNMPLDKKIILYLGSLMEGKGIDTILEATKLLNNEEFSFYIIGGDNQTIKMWKRYMVDRKINSKVTFMRFVENRFVPLYLKAADILLAPYSLKSPILQQMSPLKIFEYMASKTPFIASNVKRIAEICNNNEGLLIKVDDPIDLSEKINILTNNKELQRELVQNAYLKAKSHTYSKRCERILEFVK